MKHLFCAAFVSIFSMCSVGVDAKEHQPRQADPVCSNVLFSVEYGSFYTKDQCSISPGAAIHFDHQTDSINHTQGIQHVKACGKFAIKERGVYRVTYSVSLGCKGNVALTFNGCVIPGSEMHISKDGQLSTLSLLVNCCNCSRCGDVLSVINNNTPGGIWSDHHITLDAGDPCNVTAAIVIEKVAECGKYIKPEGIECEDPCDPCEDPCDPCNHCDCE